jgi:hypothetical protein
LLLPAGPALANGGAGASNGIISGGAAGSGFAGNPGSPGSDAAAGTDDAGGGGAFFCFKNILGWDGCDLATSDGSLSWFDGLIACRASSRALGFGWRQPAWRPFSDRASPSLQHYTADQLVNSSMSGSLMSSSEGTMDGISVSVSSSSRNSIIILCEGAVSVLSICCRSRSPTSSQIARQCLLLIRTASMANTSHLGASRSRD